MLMKSWGESVHLHSWWISINVCTRSFNQHWNGKNDEQWRHGISWHRMLWMWPVVAAPRPFWRSARRHPPMSRHTVAIWRLPPDITWCNASKLPLLQLWEPKKSIHLLLPLAKNRSAAHRLKMHDSASHKINISNSGRWMEMTEGLMTAAFTELCRDIKSSHTCKLEIHTSGYKLQVGESCWSSVSLIPQAV